MYDAKDHRYGKLHVNEPQQQQRGAAERQRCGGESGATEIWGTARVAVTETRSRAEAQRRRTAMG